MSLTKMYSAPDSCHSEPESDCDEDGVVPNDEYPCSPHGDVSNFRLMLVRLFLSSQIAKRVVDILFFENMYVLIVVEYVFH